MRLEVKIKMSNLDFPISELRIVKLYFIKDYGDGRKGRDDHPSVHMMHKSQVETFLKASLNLHHFPCYHRNGELRNVSQLWEVTAHRVNTKTTSYWWCEENLQTNGSAMGAQLNETHSYDRLWAHPELLAGEAEDERMEELYD